MPDDAVITATDPRELALLKAIGLDRAAPEQRELALAIAKRYELDLMLRHLVLIEGKPYITRDGLLHIAHRSGKFDGIETTEPHLKDGYWRSTCSAFRKDMSHPFTYAGRYPEKGGNQKFAPEMAVKVAEVMSLRRAFDVAAPTFEERWDLEGAPVIEPDKPPTLAERAAEKAAVVAAQDAVEEPVVLVPKPMPVAAAEPLPETMTKEQFKSFCSLNFIGASVALKAAQAIWPDFTWDNATGAQLAELAFNLTPTSKE